MAIYYVNFRTGGRAISKTFNSKKDALKFAYQKAKNFKSEVYIGRPGTGTWDGQIICIKNKRFYVAFNHNRNAESPYGREYVLHSDGSLGE